MTHVRGSTLPLVLALVLVAGVASTVIPAPLQAGAGADLAVATVYSGGVDIAPAVAHRGGFITVSGQGVLFRQRVAAGGSVSLGVFDPEGQLLPDGVYRWELSLTPDAATAKALRAAAKNEGRAPDTWRPVSGTFAILDGLIATGDLVEAAPVREAGLAGSGLPETLAGAAGPREAALDDDASVASHSAVEAAARAAAQNAPSAVGGLAAADRAAPERADVGALAMGASLENAPAPTQQLSGQAAERPSRNLIIDNEANGRSRSEKR